MNKEVEDSNPEQSASSYPCSQCPEVWGSKAALKFHIRRAHSSTIPAPEAELN